MSKIKNMHLSVENFGPILKGEVEFKPLTIFIGPNDSGKSYFALLAYTIIHSLNDRRVPPLQRALTVSKSLVQALSDIQYLQSRQGKIKLKDMPSSFRKVLLESADETLDDMVKNIPLDLRNYFGCEDGKVLITHGHSKSTITFGKQQENFPLYLSVRLSVGNKNPGFESDISGWQDLDIDLDTYKYSDIFIAYRDSHVNRVEKLMPLLLNLSDFYFRQLLKSATIPDRAYYLPVARSGIIQGWQVFTAMAVESIRWRFGLEDVQLQPFPGVIRDFLRDMLNAFRLPSRSRLGKNDTASILEVLEKQVFHGKITMQARKNEQPSILYESGAGQIPLHRASSMVAELAPLDLWIKYLLAPGDLLIIEEPEAHLHPENQRRVAQVLVRLIRAGVRVICTTHSSLILHQISNHLLASEAKPEIRKSQGFTEKDLLTEQDVGVYFFDKQPDGTQVKEVPTEPGFGISEDDFARVAEAIGEETYRLISH